LKEFLDNPQKKFHMRGIGRSIKLAPTSVRLHINRLIKEGLVKEKKDDVFKYFIANFDNEKFRFYKKINTLIKIQESGLIEYLNDKLSPGTIILFGSAAKGEDLANSDLDLFIQAKSKALALDKYEQSLKRKVQCFMYTSLNKAPKELRNNIINGIKIDGYIKIWN